MKTNLESLLDLPSDVIERVVEQGKGLPLAQIMGIFNSVTRCAGYGKKDRLFSYSA